MKRIHCTSQQAITWHFCCSIMWPANLLCLQDHAWMTCQSVITFQRWKNPLHFSNYIWLNWLINRILSESTTYWMGKLTTALLLWLNNNPYMQPLYEMRHSHFKYLLVLAYSLLHSTRANYLVGQNQVNITASDCMSYLFVAFIYSRASLIYQSHFGCDKKHYF